MKQPWHLIDPETHLLGINTLTEVGFPLLKYHAFSEMFTPTNCIKCSGILI